MAQSSLFRSILNRLSMLKRPVPLVSSLLVVIVGIFVWEYISHPEWFGTYSQEGTGPNEDLDLSELTPQEQAAAADIDNLRLLLNDLGVTEEGMPEIQVLPEEREQNLLLQDLLSLSVPTEDQSLSGSSNPFNEYLSQYEFADGLSQASSQSGAANSSPPAPTDFGFYLPEINVLSDSAESPSLRISPLEQALQAQEAAAAEGDVSAAEAEDSSEARSRSSSSPTAQNNVCGNTQSAAVETNSRAASIPGVPFPVVPTPTQASPPPGTTGYTPPASLQFTQPAGSSNTAGFPTNGASPLTPSGAGVPTIPSATVNPNLRSPQVDVSNGFVSPSVPSSSVAPSTEPEITPSPFAVPRPPGSFTGGGYINTFSNPSAPPE